MGHQIPYYEITLRRDNKFMVAFSACLPFTVTMYLHSPESFFFQISHRSFLRKRDRCLFSCSRQHADASTGINKYIFRPENGLKKKVNLGICAMDTTYRQSFRKVTCPFKKVKSVMSALFFVTFNTHRALLEGS